MTTYIAQMRIRLNGKLYKPNAPIELTDDELKELPKGAVAAMGADTDQPKDDPADTSTVTPPVLSPEEQAANDKLVAAVDALDEEAFKKDGGIRKDALEQLKADLGFEVTADDVAAILETKAD